MSDTTPPALPDSIYFGSYKFDEAGNRVNDPRQGYTGGNTLIDLEDAFSDSQTKLSTAANTALGELIANSSDLASVAKYQAANSALMNLFGAQTQVLKQIFDKIEAMNRNL